MYIPFIYYPFVSRDTMHPISTGKSVIPSILSKLYVAPDYDIRRRLAK